MKNALSCCLLNLGLTVALGFSLSAEAKPATSKKKSLEALDITQAPSPADWRYFMKATEHQQASLWAYQVGRGKKLKDWSWGWRLGWMRACSRASGAVCAQILRDGAFDRAVVVRAEAATALGRRYEGTKDASATGVLAQAYNNPRNFRHGHALFVQPRILYALRQIGGDAALATGSRLASANPDAKAYWTKLEAAR